MIRKYGGIIIAFTLVSGMLFTNQMSTHAESAMTEMEIAGIQASMSEAVSAAIQTTFGTHDNFNDVASLYFDSADRTKMVLTFAKEDARLNELSALLSERLPKERISIRKVKYSENELKTTAKDIFYKYAHASTKYDHMSTGVNTALNKVEVYMNNDDEQTANQIKTQYGDVVEIIVDRNMPIFIALSRAGDNEAQSAGRGLDDGKEPGGASRLPITATASSWWRYLQ